jgi:Cu-Zn family superoxide dismutase
LILNSNIPCIVIANVLCEATQEKTKIAFYFCQFFKKRCMQKLFYQPVWRIFMKRSIRSTAFLFFSTLTFSSVPLAQAAEKIHATEIPTAAAAILSPTQGNAVSGAIHFTQEKQGVKIVAEVTGLTPGEHGFHIHEFGDCTAADASSAGAHFNPSHQPHGGPDAHHRHAGDLGNLVADAAGKAHYERIDQTISLMGTASIIGHAIIVHEKPDDLRSQPVGNAGGRVACGVVGLVALPSDHPSSN